MYKLLVFGEIDRFTSPPILDNETLTESELIQYICDEIVLYKKDHSMVLFKNDKIVATFTKADPVEKFLPLVSLHTNVYNLSTDNNIFDTFYKVKCTSQ